MAGKYKGAAKVVQDLSKGCVYMCTAQPMHVLKLCVVAACKLKHDGHNGI